MMVEKPRKPKPHDYAARIPEPQWQAAQRIASLTGTSVNSLVVQGLDLVIETFNATAATMVASAASTTVTTTVDALRSYAGSSGSLSSPHDNHALLSTWSAADAHRQAIEALAGKKENP